jgi:hypothetical protein
MRLSQSPNPPFTTDLIHFTISIMKWWSEDRVAAFCIGVVLVVVVRSLGEYFRLKHVYGPQLVMTRVEPYIAGSLVAAVSVGLAFGLYLLRQHKWAIALCAVTVIGLLIYKVLALG